MLGVVALGIIATKSVLACGETKVECGPFTKWYDTNRFVMSVQDEKLDWRANWVVKRYRENNDIVIEKEEHYQGEDVRGTLMIVSGRMMLTKDLELKKGYEIDAADGPALMMQLVLNLLGHIAPEGPQAINDVVEITHKETETPVKVSTNSASGMFGVPWSVVGTLEKVRENSVRYDIEFGYPNGANAHQSMNMQGVWEIRALEPLEETMTLEGWRVYNIGPYTVKYESGTMLDYGAQKSESDSLTLGALRNEIERARTETEN